MTARVCALWATINPVLTAVTRGSTVAGAGAVTVKGAPRLTAAASMFTVTQRTSEKKKKTLKKQDLNGEKENLFFRLTDSEKLF